MRWLSGAVLGERDAARLVDVLLVVQHGVVPGQVEEVEDVLEPALRVKHELLVVDGQAARRAELEALVVHRLHRLVPLLQAGREALEVEARDGDLAADDRVHHGAAVANHEQELGAREETRQVDARLERERVLVAEARRRLAVLGDHLKHATAAQRGPSQAAYTCRCMYRPM